MSPIEYKIETWPNNRLGEPLLKDITEAIYFGALISNHVDTIEHLRERFYQAYREIALEKKRKKPSFSRLAQLSCKAHLLREAVEEADRIRTNTLEPVYTPT
jgi:hypothetical protein